MSANPQARHVTPTSSPQGSAKPDGSRIVAAPARIAPMMPEALWQFIEQMCQLPASGLYPLPPATMPPLAQRLLAHAHDMTSTLAAHHGSALRVDILQQRSLGNLHLREVFLRTSKDERIVEYGIIAIALEQFSEAQRDAVLAGRRPLGGILHHFQIPFDSSPTAFFSVAATHLTHAGAMAVNGTRCYGRFNRLSKPTGESLAWIMEILPPATES